MTAENEFDHNDLEVMDDPRDHGHSVLALFVTHSIGKRKSADQPDDVYNAVRWAWKIERKLAEGVDYIFAMEKNLCRGVFVADKWAPATKENFEKIPPGCSEDANRWAFDGERASEDIRKLYEGKILPGKLIRRSEDPVRYLWKRG